VPCEEERRKLLREEQQRQRQRMVELRGWWFERMASGPRPLQEKMVLFWHGHFATSVEKVREAYLMWRQNDLFRRMATGNWRQILIEVAKDPAMLVWLDQAQSRRSIPMKTSAREVMEFVRARGRALQRERYYRGGTGADWLVLRSPGQRFVERPFQHDNGNKTIFGKTGNFDGRIFWGWLSSSLRLHVLITARIFEVLCRAGTGGGFGDRAGSHVPERRQ